MAQKGVGTGTAGNREGEPEVIACKTWELASGEGEPWCRGPQAGGQQGQSTGEPEGHGAGPEGSGPRAR